MAVFRACWGVLKALRTFLGNLLSGALYVFKADGVLRSDRVKIPDAMSKEMSANKQFADAYKCTPRALLDLLLIAYDSPFCFDLQLGHEASPAQEADLKYATWRMTATGQEEISGWAPHKLGIVTVWRKIVGSGCRLPIERASAIELIGA